MTKNNETRPAVLDQISETQMQELERQFNEKDNDGWSTLTQSYGWSKEDSDAVHNWFGLDPEEAN
ncbi:MAG: hypothetical protein ABIQ44_04250 [Chloroflexia bacterium]